MDSSEGDLNKEVGSEDYLHKEMARMEGKLLDLFLFLSVLISILHRMCLWFMIAGQTMSHIYNILKGLCIAQILGIWGGKQYLNVTLGLPLGRGVYFKFLWDKSII